MGMKIHACVLATALLVSGLPPPGLAAVETFSPPWRIQTGHLVENAQRLIHQGQYAAAESLLATLPSSSDPTDSIEVDLLARGLLLLAECIWRGGTPNDPRAGQASIEALGIAERKHGRHSMEYAAGLKTRADLIAAQGHEARAESLYARAARIFAQLDPGGGTKLAETLNGLGSLLSESGTPSLGDSVLRQALYACERDKAPDSLLRSRIFNNIANTLLIQADPVHALPFLERAIAIDSLALVPAHPELARDYAGLALVHERLGNTARALAWHHRAGAAFEILPDVGGLSGAKERAAFAQLLCGLHRYREAMDLLQRAEAKLPESGPSAMKAFLQNEIGRVHVGLGDAEAAERTFQSALRTLKGTTSDKGMIRAQILNNLAELYSLRGDMAGRRKAAECLREAYEITESTVGAGHPDAVAELANAARVLRDLGEQKSAVSLALRAEATTRTRCRRLIRGLSEREALRFASLRTSCQGLLISIALGPGPASGAVVGIAWDQLCRGRGMVFDEILQRRRLQRLGQERSMDSLRTEYLSESEHLARQVARGPGKLAPAAYAGLIGGLQQRVESSERNLALKDEPFRSNQALENRGSEDVRSAIPKGAAVVSFVRFQFEPGQIMASHRKQGSITTIDTPSADHYAAFVVRHGEQGPRLFDLGPAAIVDQRVEAWREEIKKGRDVAGVLSQLERERTCRRAGEILRESIWTPLAGDLGGARKIFIVPDDRISMVSFAALPNQTGNFLIEDGYIFHYLSSETDLGLPHAKTYGCGILAIGNPDYGEHTPLVSGGFRQLPASGEEAEQIVSYRKAFQSSPARLSGCDDTLLLRSAATEEAFKASAPGKQAIHLATHAFVESSEPQTSGFEQESTLPGTYAGIAFAGANSGSSPGGRDDGILTAGEIGLMDLSSVEWAVLSGCNTGSGSLSPGEGVFGLRRAFRIAGANTLIMSLWSVDDEATRGWMEALYLARYRDHRDTAQATAQATHDVLSSRRRGHLSTHPCFWAAFVSTGDWR